MAKAGGGPIGPEYIASWPGDACGVQSFADPDDMMAVLGWQPETDCARIAKQAITHANLMGF